MALCLENYLVSFFPVFAHVAYKQLMTEYKNIKV